jgi:hypothetical protein
MAGRFFSAGRALKQRNKAPVGAMAATPVASSLRAPRPVG